MTSALAQVLSEVAAGLRSGAVLRTSASAAEVRAACEEAGWELGVVDGDAHPGRRGLLREAGRALRFPDWYGENFDALADCLGDLIAPTVLLWLGWGALARDDPQSYVIAVDVLGSRAAAGPAFVALLDGDGPPVDPPWIEEAI